MVQNRVHAQAVSFFRLNFVEGARKLIGLRKQKYFNDKHDCERAALQQALQQRSHHQQRRNGPQEQ